MLRPLVLAAALVSLAAYAIPPAAAADSFERHGSYLAADGVSFFQDAGARYRLLDNVDSSCVGLLAPLDGQLAKVRAEGASAPLVQKLRLCFYRDLNFLLNCENPAACPTGWTYCALVPSSTKYVGIGSATGALVEWRLAVE